MPENIKDAVSRTASSLLDGKDHLKLLEAGCGSATQIGLTFKGTVHAVGIDISKEQLERNPDVQEKILGDIQDYSLPRGEFDVVVCWMVLEHLSRPKDALYNLFNSLRPQGLLILGFPNLLSFKGIVTKVTPFWFHKLFYRLSKYSFRPFPTYLRAAIVPKNVMRLAEDNGLSVEFFELEEGGVMRTFKLRFRFMGRAFSALDRLMQVISLGRFPTLFLDNCAMILKKN